MNGAAAVADTSVLTPLTGGTLRARVAERLRDAILTGELPPGQRLVERALAQALGASVTVVREAIVALEAEGFIVKRANASTHVTSLSLAQSLQILEARALLEGHVVALAARHVATGAARPDERRSLDAAQADLREAAETGQSRDYLIADRQWHQSLWALAGNPYLVAALERAVLPLFAYAAIRLLEAQPTARAAVDLRADMRLHHDLTAAVRAGNETRARAAFARAMRRWEQDVRAHLHEPAAHEGTP